MSGVNAMDSHSTLQYLPDGVTQEQIGWAHFSTCAVAIFSPTSLHTQSIQARRLVFMQNCFYTERNTSPYFCWPVSCPAFFRLDSCEFAVSLAAGVCLVQLATRPVNQSPETIPFSGYGFASGGRSPFFGLAWFERSCCCFSCNCFCSSACFCCNCCVCC
jgi:hypothetical protein